MLLSAAHTILVSAETAIALIYESSPCMELATNFGIRVSRYPRTSSSQFSQNVSMAYSTFCFTFPVYWSSAMISAGRIYWW
jgi:hypothetical protein